MQHMYIIGPKYICKKKSCDNLLLILILNLKHIPKMLWSLKYEFYVILYYVNIPQTIYKRGVCLVCWC